MDRIENEVLCQVLPTLIEVIHAQSHSSYGGSYPPRIARHSPRSLGLFAISPDAVRAELLLMTDHYSNELFCLPNEVATSIVFPVSRLVVDPERFVEDAQEPMSAQGMGVIYTRTSDGQRLRPDSYSAQQRKTLLKTYYLPHHRRLSGAIAVAMDKHGKCLLIDGHSFASSPPPARTRSEARTPRYLHRDQRFSYTDLAFRTCCGDFPGSGF